MVGGALIEIVREGRLDTIIVYNVDDLTKSTRLWTTSLDKS